MYSFHSTKWMWLLSNKRNLYYMKTTVCACLLTSLILGRRGRPSITFPSSKLPEQPDRSIFIPQLHCNVAKDQMAKNKSLEWTLVKKNPSRCENMLKVRIGFCCGATLKPTFIPLFPKYRPSLQLRKQQPLKITKVHFNSVLILRFSGRRIIMEQKKDEDE